MSQRNSQEIRRRLATEAAKLMVDLALPSVSAARKKLIERTGQRDQRRLPDDQEIEQALREYQLLFRRDEQPQALRTLQGAALEAMQALEPFQPRLTGAVANGIADQETTIWLLVYADEPEAVLRFLAERGISARQRARRLDLGLKEPSELPLLAFTVRQPPAQPAPLEVAFELSILPLSAQRARIRENRGQSPLRTVATSELAAQIAASR